MVVDMVAGSFALLVIFTILGALGSFFFKISATSGQPLFSTHSLKNRNLILGGCLYLASAILNIMVLKVLPYTIVLPCSSITYIWSLYFSWRYLGEYVGGLKIVGMLLILTGTIIIATAV